MSSAEHKEAAKELTAISDEEWELIFKVGLRNVILTDPLSSYVSKSKGAVTGGKSIL